jgi:hypothetical protein
VYFLSTIYCIDGIGKYQYGTYQLPAGATDRQFRIQIKRKEIHVPAVS